MNIIVIHPNWQHSSSVPRRGYSYNLLFDPFNWLCQRLSLKSCARKVLWMNHGPTLFPRDTDKWSLFGGMNFVCETGYSTHFLPPVAMSLFYPFTFLICLGHRGSLMWPPWITPFLIQKCATVCGLQSLNTRINSQDLSFFSCFWDKRGLWWTGLSRMLVNWAESYLSLWTVCQPRPSRASLWLQRGLPATVGFIIGLRCEEFPGSFVLSS